MQLIENVHGDIMGFVKAEVEAEFNRLAELCVEDKRPRGEQHACRFCPFRSFTRRDRCIAHIKKYHTAERLYCASGRTDSQWHIVVALYNQLQVQSVVHMEPSCGSLLSSAASLMRDWIAPSAATMAFLQKNNDVEVALLLAEDGSKYVLRSQMVNSMRVTQQTYLDPSVANIILVASSTRRQARASGKSSTMMPRSVGFFLFSDK